MTNDEYTQAWERVEGTLDAAEAKAKSATANRPLASIALTICAAGRVLVIAVKSELEK